MQKQREQKAKCSATCMHTCAAAVQSMRINYIISSKERFTTAVYYYIILS